MTIRSRVRRFYEDAFRYGTAVRRVIGFDEQRFDLAVIEQNRQACLRIAEQAAQRSVNPPVITPDPDHAPPEMECVIIDDIALMNNRSMLTALSASGPVDIEFMMDSQSYRITGPDIRRRVENLMLCVDPPMTATEVIIRRQECMERLDLYPGGINLIPLDTRCIGSIEGETAKKAKMVLWSGLTDKQREDMFCLKRFSVKGSKSKYLYHISKGRQGNVRRDDGRQYCLTHGDLPVWDLMLAQKLMIEDDEPKFLKQANHLDEPNIINEALIDLGAIAAPDPPGRPDDGSLY